MTGLAHSLVLPSAARAANMSAAPALRTCHGCIDPSTIEEVLRVTP